MNRIKQEHGLSVADFEKILDEQAGRCAICSSEEPENGRFLVDQDNKTGVIRGLLCSTCHSLLGDPDILRRAIEYLLSSESKQHG